MARPPRPRSVHTAVVGAGQAGLVVSSLLTRAGREHVLLDRRSTLGGGWQDRWDAFRLVSPNWTTSVDGFRYRGDDPDGFMPRDELIDHWRSFAAATRAPVELETDVVALDLLDDRRAARFRLETNRGPLLARDVIVAVGPFQVPHVPLLAAALDRAIVQVHIHDYRNPGQLPPGGVLIVGSGQSGVQLAEELTGAGRAVTIAAGRCGRVPRTYRDRDIFWWLRQLAIQGPRVGLSLPTPADLPSSRLRLACNPQLTGHGQPHDVDLRRMAAAGVRVVGRFEAVDGTRARFAPDLPTTLELADRFFPDRLQGACDALAERLGLDLPPGELTTSDFMPPLVTELDLAGAGITSVLWTSGYRPTFGWLRADVLDADGLPRQVGGISAVPGLSFIGTPWLVDMGSANLVGLERDATQLVERLLAA